MSVEGPQPVAWSFVAGSALDAYTFVKLSAANTVVPCAGTTDKPIGVVQESVASGGIGKVCIVGITKVQGDADLAFGDSVGTSVDAQAAAYTASDTTKYIVGVVLIDNAAAAGLATIALNCANARTLA